MLDTVYEKLCEAIFGNEIPAGARLSVPMLAERFGISRSPIKDAVQQLVADGIAVTVPRKGVFVASFDLSDVVNLLEITEPLEAMAGRQAAQHVTDDDIARLKKLLVEQENAIASSDGSLYARLDMQFHQDLAAIAQNDRLAYMLTILHNQIRLVSRLMHFSPGHYKDSLSDHKKVLRALRARDPERVAAMLAQHVAESRVRLNKKLEQEGKNAVASD